MLEEEFRGHSFVQCLQGSINTTNKVCDFVATSYNGTIFTALLYILYYIHCRLKFDIFCESQDVACNPKVGKSCVALLLFDFRMTKCTVYS